MCSTTASNLSLHTCCTRITTLWRNAADRESLLCRCALVCAMSISGHQVFRRCFVQTLRHHNVRRPFPNLSRIFLTSTACSCGVGCEGSRCGLISLVKGFGLGAGLRAAPATRDLRIFDSSTSSRYRRRNRYGEEKGTHSRELFQVCLQHPRFSRCGSASLLVSRFGRLGVRSGR